MVWCVSCSKARRDMSSFRPPTHSLATPHPRELLSVSPWMTKRLQNLFVFNERVSMPRFGCGFFSMIPVGSIKINGDTLRTLPHTFFFYLTLPNLRASWNLETSAAARVHRAPLAKPTPPYRPCPMASLSSPHRKRTDCHDSNATGA